MSKLDDIKVRWHTQAVSYSDMEYLFCRIEELEQEKVQTYDKIEKLEKQLHIEEGQ